jgi:hypothetical protein
MSGCLECGERLGEMNVTGYCARHVRTALPCVMSVDGCGGRVSAHSRSGACSRHPSYLKAKYLELSRDVVVRRRQRRWREGDGNPS